ncbi:MAG TPA: AAA family ATPase [Chloroflexota bacterium]|nr:AAA family ATPase [Chloroflexota bacterium]
MSVQIVEPDNRRRDPELAQIERALDGFFGKLLGAWKTFIILGVVLVLFWVFVLPNLAAWSQYILYGAYMLFQLLFAILFMIVQFVALFWFLGRPRMYWIMPGETGVGFKDYVGNPEVLEVARRVVTLLRGVKEFRQMGGEVTRGVLLIGPPGTGKSYLAQCISTEAGVPFGYMSAPSIQGMFWGMDVLRVWGLYNKARKLARKYGACILFIDEIDAIGRARSGMGGGFGGAMGGFFGGGGGALNELLNQMDPLPRDDSLKAKLLRKLGLRTRKAEIPAVLTMGATNVAETLDAALLRPGRFDRKIVVDLPDFDGRKEVIAYYLNKVQHEEMDLDRFANDTIGYTPVAIKHVINEAVVNAHFNGRSKITYLDVQRAREVHEWGLRQPLKSQTVDERRLLAYHEMGHAIAQYYYGSLNDEPLAKVTIIRHGGALGLSAGRPTIERLVHSKDYFLNDIRIALASRAAEELFCESATNGVTSDFRQATYLAGLYLGVWGMNGTFYSGLAFGQVVPDAPTKREIDKLLREQYREVKQLLLDHWDECIAVAESLLDRLELDAEEVDLIIREVRKRRTPTGEPFLKFPGLDAPAKAIDFGVLPPPRDDIPRYAPKPRPPRLQGQQQDVEQPVAAASVAFDGKEPPAAG